MGGSKREKCPYCGQVCWGLATHKYFCKEKMKSDALVWFMRGWTECNSELPCLEVSQRFEQLWKEE